MDTDFYRSPLCSRVRLRARTDTGRRSGGYGQRTVAAWHEPRQCRAFSTWIPRHKPESRSRAMQDTRQCRCKILPRSGCWEDLGIEQIRQCSNALIHFCLVQKRTLVHRNSLGRHVSSACSGSSFQQLVRVQKQSKSPSSLLLSRGRGTLLYCPSWSHWARDSAGQKRQRTFANRHQQLARRRSVQPAWESRQDSFAVCTKSACKVPAYPTTHLTYWL